MKSVLTWRGITCLVVGIFVLVIGFVAMLFLLLDVLLSPIDDTVESFMTALQTEDYVTAFQEMSPPMQDDARNAQNLRTTMREYQVQPESWSFNSRRQSGGDAWWYGHVTLTDGDRHNLGLYLVNQDDRWLVESVYISGKLTLGYFKEDNGFDD